MKIRRIRENISGGRRRKRRQERRVKHNPGNKKPSSSPLET
jgi:hypothetical protein